ncbi:hypothetical protein BJ508DRAFT_314781 [Ascobolus immersus RN42]|uniref:Uncharacterized protein n=1 Tax=Ascobolus immersus RN42 TaxID=1160509 RepID=A0A3N4HRV9_ASCIM|nr:hypothetical protein BJ508DRAFT_314781 [Ascobolus immersus RN42]
MPSIQSASDLTAIKNEYDTAAATFQELSLPSAQVVPLMSTLRPNPFSHIPTPAFPRYNTSTDNWIVYVFFEATVPASDHSSQAEDSKADWSTDNVKVTTLMTATHPAHNPKAMLPFAMQVTFSKLPAYGKVAYGQFVEEMQARPELKGKLLLMTSIYVHVETPSVFTLYPTYFITGQYGPLLLLANLENGPSTSGDHLKREDAPRITEIPLEVGAQ